MRGLVIAPVAKHKIHRYIERPFDIVHEPEIVGVNERQLSRALVVGVAPDIATPGNQAVGLAFGKGRRGEQGGRQRLQLHAELHFPPHVGF